MTIVVLTAEMPANHVVGYRKKALVRAFGTFDSRFFADSLDPLITASRRIASPACSTTLEAARVDIFSSAKQGTEEGDFGLGGRALIHASLLQGGQAVGYVHDHILHLPRRSDPTENLAIAQGAISWILGGRNNVRADCYQVFHSRNSLLRGARTP